MNNSNTLSRAERQKIQLQNEIIHAAFLEFSERGYHQTAISDIAKRLGIGHGTFYRHFENKRDILEKVIVDTMFKINQLLSGENAPQAVNNLQEYRLQCERIAEQFIEFARENPRTLKLILLEATSIDTEMTRYIQNLLEVSGLMTANYLQNGVQLGFLRENLDVNSTGHAIIGMITNGALLFLANPNDIDALRRYAQSIIELIVTGMANHSA